MALHRWTPCLQQKIGVVIQLPLSRHARVQRPQCARRCISRISKPWQIGTLALVVHPLERPPLHDHFPAHFKILLPECLVLHPQRQGTDGARILRHLFPNTPIAPRQSLRKSSSPVVRCHGESVQLQLRHILERFGFQKPAHPPVELQQFRLIQGVIQAQHRRAVLHFGESVARLASHPLRRRMGRSKLRMCLFERLQFTHQRVVGCVRNLRLI